MKLKEKFFGSENREPGLFIALLFLTLLFTWLAMSPCLNNDFTNWDDVEYITQNPRIRTLSWENVKNVFSTPEVKMYTPLSILSYALEYHFSGLDPKIYHATNLFLHLADTALVMLLARLLLNSVWVAFLVALLFGIHPAHVESVAWAAERKDVLYAFFYLSSLTVYTWRPDKASARSLSLVLFSWALLSKSMAITLPLALLATNYLKSEKIEPRRWLNTLPFFICAGIFTAMQLSWSGGMFSLGWGQRLLFALYNLGFYFYTLLWPFSLSAMYYSPLGGKTGFYIIAACALAGIFLLWKYFRRDKEIVFGAAFYAVLLLPVLQFFPFGGVISSDRYTYLSSIGIFIIGAVCARRLWRRLPPGYRGLAAICAISAVLTLAVAARVRCAVWKDSVSLWTKTVSEQPLAGSALTNLCDAYLKAGMNDEAAACLARAMRTFPDNNNRYNVCRLFLQNKDFPKAEECFTQLLKVNPCHALALNYMGDIYLRKGAEGKAERYYSQAAGCDNNFAAAYLNLGSLALLRKDKAKAASFYEKALAAEPADRKTRALLGTLR